MFGTSIGHPRAPGGTAGDYIGASQHPWLIVLQNSEFMLSLWYRPPLSVVGGRSSDQNMANFSQVWLMLHAVNVSHVGIPTHHLSVFKLGTGLCAVFMADAVLTGKVHLSVNFRTLPRGSARASFAKQTALASEDGVGELVLCLCLSDCIFLSICSVFLSV